MIVIDMCVSAIARSTYNMQPMVYVETYLQSNLDAPIIDGETRKSIGFIEMARRSGNGH